MKFKKSLSIIISLMSLSSSTYAKNIDKNNLICEKNIKKKHWLLKPWKELNETEKKKVVGTGVGLGTVIGVPAAITLCYFLNPVIDSYLYSHFEKKNRELFGTNTFDKPGNLENFKKEVYALLDYKVNNSNYKSVIKNMLETHFDPIYKAAVLIYGIDNLDKYPIKKEVHEIALQMILVAKELNQNPDMLERLFQVEFDYRHIFSIYLLLCKTNYTKFKNFCWKHKEVLNSNDHSFKISDLNDLFDLKTKSTGDNRFSFHFYDKTAQKFQEKYFSLNLHFNRKYFCTFKIYENGTSTLQIYYNNCKFDFKKSP